MHCTQKFEHIFPEMKLCSLISNFYIHVSGRALYIPTLGLIFGIKQWLAAVPCPPLCSCGWAKSSHKWLTYKFTIWKITVHKWKQLILVVNFLFGFSVNEIPNKTLILDSHRPFICSVIVSQWEDAGFEPLDLTQHCSYWCIEEWDCIEGRPGVYRSSSYRIFLLPLGIDKKKKYSAQRSFCSFLYNVMARTSFKKEFT